jgi:hypothetical protein
MNAKRIDQTVLKNRILHSSKNYPTNPKPSAIKKNILLQWMVTIVTK